MVTARVQKPAEPASAPQVKKPPFFPAAAAQPKMQVHKPEGASPEAHAPAPVNVPVIRPLPVKPSPQAQSKPGPESTFFKPAAAAAQTAVVRNMYEAKSTQVGAAIAGGPAAANKSEAAGKAAAVPVVSVADKAGAAVSAGMGAVAAHSEVPAGAPHAESAAKAHGEQAAHAAIAPSTEAPKQKEAVQPDSPKSNTPMQEGAAAPAKGGHAAAATAAGGEAAHAGGGATYKHLNPAKTDAVFHAKQHKAGALAKKTAKTKSAADKIEESKAAQNTPAEESQAKSNQGQVGDFSGHKKDPKTEDEARHTLDSSITANMPTTLKAVDEFKESGKGKEISKTVMGQVNSDVADVKAGYEGISKTPDAAPAEQGAPLPAPEQAEQVAPINMGAGVVPQIEKPELETKQYTSEVDNKLKDEGLTQEHLDLVDSGDLSTANKERKKLQQDVVSQPAEVQHMAAHEHTKVAAEMLAHETNSRAEMHGHRDQHLSKTAEKQQKAKEELERKRAEVAKNINDRYKACQTSIMSKLDNLEKSSLAQFDAGQAKATSEFEDQVNRDIDKFKDKRYDRIGGSLLWLKDKLFGIDDFPEVVQAFNDARKTFADKIDTLIATITKANNEVIAGCKKELEDTKTGIKSYVDSLGPQLKDAATKAEVEVNKELQQLSAEIDKRKEKLQQALADKRKAAMDAIDKKIEAMKEKLKGAVSIIGNLLLKAALKFFQWALESVGLSPDSIMGVINKGVSIIKAIVSKPMVFVGNLIKAAKLGLWNFAKNFLTHLKDALFNWLTGALEGVTLPKVWDMKGIFFLSLDIIGLSYPAIRRKMVNLMGETTVVILEKTFTLVKTLVTEGPAAAWEQLKEMADEIKTTFIDAIKEWVRYTIIFKAIETIVEIFVPGAGIVKAIIGIYDTVMFFIQKAKQIAQMVSSFLDSVGDIVAGRIDGAAGALEGGLATALTLVINFLAKFLHLDGITDKIKKAIETIRSKVDKVLDKVVLWIRSMAGKLVAKGKAAVSSAVGWVKDLLGIEQKFNAKDGSPHRLYFAPAGEQVTLMLNPDPAGPFDAWIKASKAPEPDKAAARELGNKITAKRADNMPPELTTKEQQDGWEKAKLKEIKGLLKELSDKMSGLFAAGNPVCATDGKGVVFDGLNKKGYGTKMTATFLTDNGLNEGTVPSVSSGPFETINKRRYEGGASYYILGHLLNMKLGGAGDSWKNLTPISRRTNSRHETRVESIVKKAVKDGHIVRYEVKAEYGGHGSELISNIKANANKTNSNKDMNDIMAEEAGVPSSLECKADLVTLDPADPTKVVTSAPLIAGISVKNDLTDPPDY